MFQRCKIFWKIFQICKNLGYTIFFHYQHQWIIFRLFQNFLNKLNLWKFKLCITRVNEISKNYANVLHLECLAFYFFLFLLQWVSRQISPNIFLWHLQYLQYHVMHAWNIFFEGRIESVKRRYFNEDISTMITLCKKRISKRDDRFSHLNETLILISRMENIVYYK